MMTDFGLNLVCRKFQTYRDIRVDILPSWNDVRQTRLSLLRGCQAEQMVKRNLPSGIFVFYLHKPLTNRFLRVNGKQPGERKTMAYKKQTAIMRIYLA